MVVQLQDVLVRAQPGADGGGKIAPFTPPLFGYKKLANFEVYSYPGPASYALALVALVLAASLFVAWRQGRSVAA